jgi:hypothetical protein
VFSKCGNLCDICDIIIERRCFWSTRAGMLGGINCFSTTYVMRTLSPTNRCHLRSDSS